MNLRAVDDMSDLDDRIMAVFNYDKEHSLSINTDFT